MTDNNPTEDGASSIVTAEDSDNRMSPLLNGTQRRAVVILVVLVALAQCTALLLALPTLDADRGDTPTGTDGDGGLGTDSTSGFDIVLGQVVALLAATLLALVMKRQSLFSNRTLLRAAILVGMALFAVFPVAQLTVVAGYVLTGSVPPLLVAAAIAIGIVGGLTALAGWRPTWYSLSALGLLTAVGSIVMIGIQWGILPVLVLCGLLLLYDALAVYGSGHMIEIAEGAVGLKVPILVLIPTRTAARPLDGESTIEDAAESVALGLGDIIIPGLLVVASARAISTGLVPIGPMELPVATVLALVGSIAGLVGIYALDDRPHAGLPPMLGGGLLGYFGGALVTGTSLRGALGLAGVDVGALVTGQTAALVLGIVVVGAALFLYGSREGVSE